MARTEITIGETFDRPTGEYNNFGAIPAGQEAQLRLQKHTDIRCMEQGDLASKINMLYLDLLPMTTLNTLTMGDLDSSVIIKRGERWSAGVFGPQTDRNNWSGMSLSCAVGANVTQSILVT